MSFASRVAYTLNKILNESDIQICVYSQRYIIKRGNMMVADGNSLRVNGKGGAFLVGSFKAYKYE